MLNRIYVSKEVDQSLRTERSAARAADAAGRAVIADRRTVDVDEAQRDDRRR